MAARNLPFKRDKFSEKLPSISTEMQRQIKDESYSSFMTV
jgi:hypothetical protein